MIDNFFACCLKKLILAKPTPLYSLTPWNSRYSENKSSIDQSSDSHNSSQGNDTFTCRKKGAQCKKKKKTHDVEQSSNKDEIEQSRSNQNEAKGLTANGQTLTEGDTSDSQYDEVKDFDYAQNEEDMKEITDD